MDGAGPDPVHVSVNWTPSRRSVVAVSQRARSGGTGASAGPSSAGRGRSAAGPSVAPASGDRGRASAAGRAGKRSVLPHAENDAATQTATPDMQRAPFTAADGDDSSGFPAAAAIAVLPPLEHGAVV